MTRKLTGAVVGIVLAMLVVALVQTVGHYLFPEPELPANPSPQQLRDAVAAAPVGAKAMVVLSWFLGALVGVWAALRISNGARRSALVVAGAVLLLTIAVLLSVTHPTWMVALGLLVPVLATFLATRIVPFAEA
nr:hypothetical protein [uncultured Hyphomonas sp.]